MWMKLIPVLASAERFCRFANPVFKRKMPSFRQQNAFDFRFAHFMRNPIWMVIPKWPLCRVSSLECFVLICLIVPRPFAHVEMNWIWAWKVWNRRDRTLNRGVGTNVILFIFINKINCLRLCVCTWAWICVQTEIANPWFSVIHLFVFHFCLILMATSAALSHTHTQDREQMNNKP